MIDLIERLEKMGRRGAAPALILAVVLVVVAVWAVATNLSLDLGSRWGRGGVWGIALFAGAMAMVFGMIGVRLLTARTYPSPAELFPSLDKDAFIRAVLEEERPLCVCTRCLIHLPAQFSTGACPRCNSSVDYYEIATDEDAEMVILGLTA